MLLECEIALILKDGSFIDSISVIVNIVNDFLFDLCFQIRERRFKYFLFQSKIIIMIMIIIILIFDIKERVDFLKEKMSFLMNKFIKY